MGPFANQDATINKYVVSKDARLLIVCHFFMPIINRIKQYFVTLTHILFKDKCILLLELRSLHNREPSSFLI